MVTNNAQAKEWEIGLGRRADSHCRATAQLKGPPLFGRLQAAFLAVDQYIDKLGDVKRVFDSEYQYFCRVDEEQRRGSERLAFRVGSLRDSPDDVRLACLVLLKFGAEIEGQLDPFLEQNVHEDSVLRARIYLLADYIRDARKAYSQDHGG